MSRPWIRLYTNVRHNPKLQRLPDHLFKFVVNSWTAVADNDDFLPSVEDLAWDLKIEPELVESYIEHLIKLRVFDRVDDKVIPHNWMDRQFLSDISTERVRQFRERRMKRPRNVSETAQDSDQTQIQTRSEQTQTARAPRLPKGYAFDEQYKTFREACTAFGMPVIESDFTNGAWHEWCTLDPEQRQAAILGIEARAGAGADPTMVPRPHKYLVNREWRRAVKPSKPMSILDIMQAEERAKNA